MNNQLYFVKHKNLGFNAKKLLNLAFDRQLNNRLTPLVNNLSEYSGIKNLTASFGIPGIIQWKGWPSNDHKLRTSIIDCYDTSFLSTLGIKILEGRNFIPGDFNHSCLVNQIFMDSMKWDDFHGRKFQDYDIIGVIDNFHFASLHDPIDPLCLLFQKNAPTFISLRLTGNRIGETLSYIKKTWKELYPDYPFEYQFYDDWFKSMYNKEEKLGKLLSVFTILAITISSLGIWGFSFFSCESRAKEMCIRKIQGASSSTIFLLLSREYILIILLSIALARPIAYYIVIKWLENFAYKTHVTVWYFILAGFLSIIIAWISIAYHALRTALINPVKVLKYE